MHLGGFARCVSEDVNGNWPCIDGQLNGSVSHGIGDPQRTARNLKLAREREIASNLARFVPDTDGDLTIVLMHDANN